MKWILRSAVAMIVVTLVCPLVWAAGSEIVFVDEAKAITSHLSRAGLLAP